MAAFGHPRPPLIAFNWLLLSLAGYWLRQDGGEGMVIGLSLLLYSLLTTRIVSGFQQGLFEAMAVRYDQQTNIRQLTAPTQRLDGANRALAEKNALFRSLFNNGHQLMAYLDRQFNFVFANQAYAAAGRQPANEDRSARITSTSIPMPSARSITWRCSMSCTIACAYPTSGAVSSA